MKKRLIYNLGRRGFFSEINNMVLAKIYADRHHLDFTINSYYWNCRYKKGIRDYFNNDIDEQNIFLAAQITRNKSRFVFAFTDLHTFFHNINYIKNTIYSFLHKDVLLGADIFEEIRSNEFLDSICPDTFNKKLRDVLRLKTSTLDGFNSSFIQLGIMEPFLGIHIRRGDKITTGEMRDIPLDRYIEESITTSFKSIYVATDDIESINYLKKKMEPLGIHIYYNPTLSGNGFSEGSFNHASRESRYKSTLTLLFDIYVLSKASYFIGTYSSNLSRVIPCFLGLDNCKSLDENWYIG